MRKRQPPSAINCLNCKVNLAFALANPDQFKQSSAATQKPPTPSQPKKYNKLFMFAILSGVAILACFCLSIVGSSKTKPAPTGQAITQQSSQPNSSPSAQSAEQMTVIPTLTRQPTFTPQSTNPPMPTSTPVPTKPPAPTPTTEPKKVGLLPGLQPADVKVNLENRQFKCSSAEMSADKTYYVWTCKRDSSAYQMTAIFYGRTLLTVDYINCAVVQFGQADDGIASPFLGFMATMPYDGAEPQRARTWVEQTLPTIKQSGDVREATFGGVKHRLFGIPTARNLQIGDLR